MALRALRHFRSMLIWNDVLASATQRGAPTTAAATYRRLLQRLGEEDEDPSGNGCVPPWVALALLDAAELEAWRRDREAGGHLSIRELVRRAGDIEAAAEAGIARLSPATSTRSNTNGDGGGIVETSIVLTHALLVYLHTIVSGPRAGVPEIRQGIDRAVTAWQALSLLRRPAQSSGEGRGGRSLAWAYCVTASLATGAQREVFRDVAAAHNQLLDLKTIVDECWREVDGRAADGDAAVDWRDMMERANLSVLFM